MSNEPQQLLGPLSQRFLSGPFTPEALFQKLTELNKLAMADREHYRFVASFWRRCTWTLLTILIAVVVAWVAQ